MDDAKNVKVFLFIIALLQFSFPLTLHGQIWAGVYVVLYAAMILFGILILRSEWKRIEPILVIGIAFLGFAVWVVFAPTYAPALLGKFLSLIIFQGCLVYFLLKFIFRHSDTPGPNLIFAAICVYLLLGSLFAALFSTVEVFHPGSFTDTLAPDQPTTWQQLMYFSFVTMATLGYGEILPVTAWARALSILETVAGTLFLTTVIARLVGAYVSQEDEPERSSQRSSKAKNTDS